LRQNKTLFILHFETGQNSFTIFCRLQSWSVASFHTANTDETRQDCLVGVVNLALVWTG